IMQMAEGMDTGDMMKQAAVPIGENDTSEELYPRLAALGAMLLGQVVYRLEQGMVTWTPQDDAFATRAPMLTRDLSPVDWTKSADVIHNQVRGLLPWPTATATLGGVKFKLYGTRLGNLRTNAPAGEVLQTDKAGIHVACGDGRTLVITHLQAEGGKRMAAVDYLRGHPLTF
ncbi:MAG TPA: formyltransferase family protein, partial [Oscillospiraceae bacterium]|nr:formyltransferase family protein [Oscillospiraceae bacterium]